MWGFFYVQEDLVPGCLVDDVWLWVHCRKITIVFLEISLALAKHFIPVIISFPVKIDSKKNKKKVK
jgi:hypothetical protein